MRARRRNDNFCVFENRERWKVNSCLNERGRENECKSERIHIECLPGQLVVAQLVERSLSTPEVCSSNPGIGKLQYRG